MIDYFLFLFVQGRSNLDLTADLTVIVLIVAYTQMSIIRKQFMILARYLSSLFLLLLIMLADTIIREQFPELLYQENWIQLVFKGVAFIGFAYLAYKVTSWVQYLIHDEVYNSMARGSSYKVPLLAMYTRGATNSMISGLTALNILVCFLLILPNGYLESYGIADAMVVELQLLSRDMAVLILHPTYFIDYLNLLFF